MNEFSGPLSRLDTLAHGLWVQVYCQIIGVSLATVYDSGYSYYPPITNTVRSKLDSGFEAAVRYFCQEIALGHIVPFDVRGGIERIATQVVPHFTSNRPSTAKRYVNIIWDPVGSLLLANCGEL